MELAKVSRHRAVMIPQVAKLCAEIIVIALLIAPRSASAQSFTVDTTASEALTNYLRQNRLPLVGAQIGTASTGARRLVLYGYVATQMGKSDAETKALAHLGGTPPEVVNRIMIQSEIAKLKSASHRGSPDASSSGVNDYTAGGAPAGAFAGQSFDQVIDDIQRYGIKSAPDDQTGP
jgi:hypothetical protein